MPAALIDYGARMLKPVENFAGGYTRLFDNLDNTKVVDAWHAMNTWVSDAIPLAGKVARVPDTGAAQTTQRRPQQS